MKPRHNRYDIEELKTIMARLRDRENGCPWDIKQNFKSIAPYTLEEAYEVVDAIEKNNKDELCDELGDLLFQVIYHAQMADEEEAFEFDDVVHAICTKLVRRHPHVFGNEDLSSDEEIRDMWERVKREEKADTIEDPSLLADIPVGLPAMTRAVKLQKRAAQVGFDWPDAGPVLEKIQEELDELKEAMAEPETVRKEKVQEEFGDLLFVMANLSRHLKIDPEAAVRTANKKFVDRFGYIEQTYEYDKEKMKTASLEEMDALWDEAKMHEKKGS